MAVGERIRQARISRGVSQKELAERLGVTPPLIGHYERGKRNPKIETIQRISQALDVTPGYLLGFAKEMDSPYTYDSLPVEQMAHDFLALNLLAHSFPEVDLSVIDTRKSNEIVNKVSEINKLWVNTGRLSVGALTQEEAVTGLKFIMTYWYLPWKQYGDDVLAKLVESQMFKDFIKNALDIFSEGNQTTS